MWLKAPPRNKITIPACLEGANLNSRVGPTSCNRHLWPESRRKPPVFLGAVPPVWYFPGRRRGAPHQGYVMGLFKHTAVFAAGFAAALAAAPVLAADRT